MDKVVRQCEILLPHGVDYEKWAVIACDQFTSQKNYWTELEKFVGDAPSTLKITYPEIYLNDNMDYRITQINKTMQHYLDEDLFDKYDSFVLVERTVESGKKRVSLVVSVDLECYDWNRVEVPIRASEDTIMERLPVRLKIREHAPIELPHIILLIDDIKKEIIENLYCQRDKLTKLYDFELNMGGGHIRGWKVDNCTEIIQQFETLLDEGNQIKKYGKNAKIMFAVGDGNHSMATAKQHWINLKKTLTEEEIKKHPARFCLAEVLNIYDEGLDFEPIHRVVTKYDDNFLSDLEQSLQGEGKLKIVTKEKDFFVDCPCSGSQTIKAVQEFIEERLKRKLVEVDYIHGEHHTRKVVSETEGIGILMPEFTREELFDYVVNVGNLPKKAFSIGTAENKKYYLEAKRIK